MCGEQQYRLPSEVRNTGSPPRVRGTESQWPPIPQDPRITPACAGNSKHGCLPQLRGRDHPRVCGEQSKAAFSAARIWGSPPRVRGTAPRNGAKHLTARITPACAGNSYITNRIRTAIRITPACAGNSSVSPPCAACRRDHPRVCGEQRYFPITLSISPGSPPRVRGTASIFWRRLPGSRITPACAGNSRFKSLRRRSLRDHPRVCGEQNLPGSLRLTRKGSPPRVRGTASISTASE